jgi:HAD superfamily hydrolase (TIGR01490 family)
MSTAESNSSAAFFDVDRTLIPGAYGERIFIRYLMDNNALTWRDLTRYTISVLAGGDFFRRQAWEGNKAYLKGHRAKTIERLAEICFRDRILPRLSPKGLTVVEDHLRRGHKVFFISASLSYLIKPLQNRLGAHGMQATRLASEDGFLTGEIRGTFLYGPMKAALVLQWIPQWKLDLSRCFAYTDHHSDIPLLEMVGHPVAVNPDKKLRRQALKRGWPVTTF